MLKYISIFVLTLLLGGNVQAQQTYVAGTHYSVMHNGAADQSGVTEIFAYQCSICLSALPKFDQLRRSLPSGTHYSRISADSKLARLSTLEVSQGLENAYQIAATLQNTDAIHKAVFTFIHVNPKRIPTINDISTIFQTQGLSTQQFQALSKNFAILSAQKNAQGTLRSFGDHVTSLPTLIVNGKYSVNLQVTNLNGLVAHLLTLN